MITASKFETDLGSMIACSVNGSICLLEFNDRKMLPGELRFLERTFQDHVSEGDSEVISNLREELSEYFRGLRKEFSIPLNTPGTPFQQAVWNELKKIEYGKTRSYLEQASALGMEGAVRAVANANGMNRIAIIIPCHRVIGSDGRLTGYGGGIERKRWLLNHENRYSVKKQDMLLF